jgi:hypothetical protein
MRGMNNPDEIAGLLREIRDLLAGREAKYDDHLRRLEEIYERQTEKSQRLYLEQMEAYKAATQPWTTWGVVAILTACVVGGLIRIGF